MWSRLNVAEEMVMEKGTETVYYYTYLNDKGEPVRPRRPGTLLPNLAKTDSVG
jgi:hypothetical protein